MVIKVYTSSLSGNKEVKKRQQRVLMILDSKSIKYEVIDITEPGSEADKDFMQANSKSNGATIGDPNPRHPLPPQVFNDDEYCGDYDLFDAANENDKIEEFLKMEPPSNDENGLIPNHVEELETAKQNDTVEPPQTNGDHDPSKTDEQQDNVQVNGNKSRSASKESSPTKDTQEAGDANIADENVEKETEAEMESAEKDEESVTKDADNETKDEEHTTKEASPEKMEVVDEPTAVEKENAPELMNVDEKDKSPEKDLSPSEALIENEKATADN